MSKPLLKWSPAHPTRTKDNLISSAAREKGQTGFKPSYESESKQHMNFLMSNEYMRMWYKERGQYEKDIYSREETIKEESKIKRRVVQRMMTYRRPLKNDFIDDIIQKKKGNAPLEQVTNPDKMKYKPDCHRKGGDKGKSQTKSPEADKNAGAESKPQNTSSGDKQKISGGDKQKHAKKAKQSKEDQIPEKAKTTEKDDECDEVAEGDEVILIAADTANVECCECEPNT